MGKDNKLHIILLGRRNSGKSSLINALTGQNIAIVSDVAGTTTDLVKRSYEIPDFASVIFIDTAGIDDTGTLGEMRVEKTRNAISQADMALLVITDNRFEEPEQQLAEQLKKLETPFLVIHNKRDEVALIPDLKEKLTATYNCPVIDFSTREDNTTPILDALKSVWKKDNAPKSLIGDLLTPGDIVLLITPIDSEAPAGRLILPQVQTIRELLDKKCLIATCTTDKLPETLHALAHPPKLIITDSQVFKTVYEQKPEESKLTSFSVLFAGYKGDIHYYVKSAAAIEMLTESSRVLIAEACTHAPLSEDIGRVKLPRLLRKRIGEKLQIDIVGGIDFPQDLTPYSLVIHCGACMFNRKYVLSRIELARKQNIPMTNYGVAIAFLNGILDRIEY